MRREGIGLPLLGSMRGHLGDRRPGPRRVGKGWKWSFSLDLTTTSTRWLLIAPHSSIDACQGKNKQMLPNVPESPAAILALATGGPQTLLWITTAAHGPHWTCAQQGHWPSLSRYHLGLTQRRKTGSQPSRKRNVIPEARQGIQVGNVPPPIVHI